MSLASPDRRLHLPDIQSRAELLAQLTHVAGQLAAPSAASAALPLLDELLDIAGALEVPVDKRRDDSHVFFELPGKIVEATWTQCGGMLHSLRHSRVPKSPAIAAEVAQRILRLAPTHR